MLDTRPALIIATILGMLLGTFLHAAAIAISVHGKLLADESSADEGRYFLDDENSTAVCANPDSQLNDWLKASIAKRLTLWIEVEK